MNDRYQIEIRASGDIDSNPLNRYRLRRDAVKRAKELVTKFKALINRDPMQPAIRVLIYDSKIDRITWDSGYIKTR